MRRIFPLVFIIAAFACTGNKQAYNNTDTLFTAFKQRFMDDFWKHNPSYAIGVGYGKYYELLNIPDSAGVASDITFANNYLDTLHAFDYNSLSDNNKIDYKILQNQFNSTKWYIDTFKQQQWDPSAYNLSGDCYQLLNIEGRSLNEKLLIISKHFAHAPAYYAAALQAIHQPTKEHTQLAVQQNEGGLPVFEAVADSVKVSTLSPAEKDTVLAHINQTITAVKTYTTALKTMLADVQQQFRSFRIGKTLFAQKFTYDMVSDHTAEEMFNKAVAAKQMYHTNMYIIADSLWPKYCGTTPKPADSLLLIKTVIDKIALHHATPQGLLDSATKQVKALSRFIVTKNLFDYDTSFPVIVRIMPAYEAGVTLASAEFTPPYSQRGPAYYNVADLTKQPAAQAESSLRECNDYTLQILSIHEAMPGHCLQSIYSSKKSPDIIQSIFGNGATVEGWAVYVEKMMLDNGWGNNSPEMWLMFYKWSLRECINVIVDYGVQCLNYSKEDVTRLLKNEAFQEDAQIAEKYHRATVSQVQLCSYFTGASDINSLRDAYKQMQGPAYSLKNFHEKFLSYGSAPVAFIQTLMLNDK
jgi:uncharacterized protein (DUF885 family)